MHRAVLGPQASSPAGSIKLDFGGNCRRGRLMRSQHFVAPARFLILLLALTSFVPQILADQAKPLGDDPEVEKRLNKLSQELRCLVCQNETLADSRADLAEDLRREIRAQIRAGKSDKEIIDFLTQRYGEFVLYRPVVGPRTYLLWFGPFVLLLLGLTLLFRYVKSRRELIADEPLSSEEQRRVEEMLGSKSGKDTA